MKMKLTFLSIVLLITFFLTGCFTQLDLIDKTEQREYYYGKADEVDEDSLVDGEYYAESYDPYYDFYTYWDPLWYYPRGGFFIGYYPWYSWRYHHYSPFGQWWYHDYYYSRWYYPVHGYSHKRDFQRRKFDRRSPYDRSGRYSRIVSRTPNDKLLTDNVSRYVQDKNRTKVNVRKRTRPSIRNDRAKYRSRSVIRKSGGKKYTRASSSRRPSFSSGRSSSFRSSGRGSVSRSGGSSGSRSSNTSSRRSSRR